MGQPSWPPPPIPFPPPPPPSLPPLPIIQAGANDADCQVRCAGCKMILTVGAGLTEFVCPKCNLPQMLPPELLRTPQQQQRTVAAHGIDPTKIQLPCAHCKAILNVPHGLSRFNCPQCGVDLAVDLSKIRQFFPPDLPGAPSFPMPPLPDEVNEVAMEVEREEDEGGMAGETFMDYRPPKLSIGPPHPDSVVETSSLSAVQPPEPTYNLAINDDLERSKALSCLQIETLVYACQRHLQHLSTGVRAGFFVGDGAGVGKGRTIAGLIWENWHHKRRKALWISVGSDLKFDSKRDLDDVGASCIEAQRTELATQIHGSVLGGDAVPTLRNTFSRALRVSTGTTASTDVPSAMYTVNSGRGHGHGRSLGRGVFFQRFGGNLIPSE